jgi:hypothetical protein
MVAITFQPLRANSCAVACPKPVEAPVMSTVLAEEETWEEGDEVMVEEPVSLSSHEVKAA